MNPTSLLKLRTILPGMVLAFCALLVPSAASAGDKLALRVNDAKAGPGDLVAVVVRTYASRPIGQGQIAVRGKKRASRRGNATALSSAPAGLSSQPEALVDEPFVKLEKAVVFSANQDARFQVSFGPEGAVVEFRSPSGSINSVDGPLAVFYFRVSDQVQEGEEYDIDVEVANSFIVAPSGERVEIENRPGELRIEGKAEDLDLSAVGGRVKPGKVAKLNIQTQQPVPLSGGRVALRYDPKVVAGNPWVIMDPRYGQAQARVDAKSPGLLVIDFQSPKARLNQVPGEIFQIRMATRRDVKRGTRVPLELVDDLTYLLDDEGDVLSVDLIDGQLVFK